ncbi:murein hydrolase activator EnvC family protein [Magnetospirillum molischianum]|uniref:Membrane-bound metallopeptidase n=1 Tax=Magnetospirillum molischianum DSM 120 TaxID=1150626 RepID=H8FT29_MAGML|nr:peptidoglycan DD-metalloendopeptidase family protein [Magnetospirillum molischianum]CCG41517.1 Membrane-bound metallopeptidase [Magnetospirillum molischianum DSM 120]
MLLLLLTGAGAALAQSLPPANPNQRLRELEAELDRSRAAHDEIRSKAAGLAAETGRLRADMVKAARAAQESEDLLSELEFQLDGLREREESRSEALKRRSQQMVGVLTALQRLAWRPTEALIAQPQSPADTVRSAILLRAAVPQIEQSAHDLRGEIDSVTRLRVEIGEQKKRIAATATRLEQEHDRLKDMVDRKSRVQRETEEERRSVEIRMQDLATQAEDLRDLLARLEQERERRIAEAAAKAAAEKAAREAELAAQKAAREAELAAQKAAREAELAAQKAARNAELAAQKAARNAELAAQKAEQQAAAEAREREKAQARAAREAEIAAQAEAREKQLAAQKATEEAEQAAREADATRLTRTGKPFSQMQGHLPFPARGRVVESFGQTNDVGHQTKGISIQTRKGAQVIAPHDGQVVFAGPFRGYGLLLILEHSEGYHTLLAGMARVDSTVGQRLTAGEPVGVMGQDDAKPALYLELRHHGQPVNPLPWLMARNNKASG